MAQLTINSILNGYFNGTHEQGDDAIVYSVLLFVFTVKFQVTKSNKKIFPVKKNGINKVTVGQWSTCNTKVYGTLRK